MRKLLQAGLKVFDERGYQAARVDDVVKAARTSHGTFYLYFANKEDLFRSLAADCAASMTKLTDQLQPISADEDGFHQVRDWIGEFSSIYRRHGAVIRAWAEAQVTNRELLKLGLVSMDNILKQLAKRIDEANEGMVDADSAALAMLSMLERFNYYVLSRRIEHDDDAVLDTVARLVHVGLFAGAGAPA
jgi:AcrR family transcriptional regulator